jgi:hypothetical protein
VPPCRPRVCRTQRVVLASPAVPPSNTCKLAQAVVRSQGAGRCTGRTSTRPFIVHYSSGYGHHAKSSSREASTEHNPIQLRTPQGSHPCQGAEPRHLGLRSRGAASSTRGLLAVRLHDIARRVLPWVRTERPFSLRESPHARVQSWLPCLSAFFRPPTRVLRPRSSAFLRPLM